MSECEDKSCLECKELMTIIEPGGRTRLYCETMRQRVYSECLAIILNEEIK